jgi:hypothetical protein
VGDGAGRLSKEDKMIEFHLPQADYEVNFQVVPA